MENYTWYNTPVTEFSDLGFAFSQADADVQATVEKKDGNLIVTLENNSPVISFMNILKVKDASGNLVVPAYWSDNFFPLFPYQKKTVTCRLDRDDVTFELDN